MASDTEEEVVVVESLKRFSGSGLSKHLHESNVSTNAKIASLKTHQAAGRTLGDSAQSHTGSGQRKSAHYFFCKALSTYHRPTTLPPLDLSNFNASLRAYQKRGVQEMRFLEDNFGGGVLADAMGLGKTIQVLALVAQDKKSPDTIRTPTLIVVPKSLMQHWQKAILQFLPKEHYRYAAHWKTIRPEDGFPQRLHLSYHEVRGLDIVLVTYDTIEVEYHEVMSWKEANEASIFDERRPTSTFWTAAIKTARPESYIYSIKWYRIILDESQRIRVHDSRITKALLSPLLGTGKRWGITATPFQYWYKDLFAYFALLRIQPWNDFRFFRSTFDWGGSGTLSTTILPGHWRDLLHINFMAFTIRRDSSVLQPALPTLIHKVVPFRLKQELKVQAFLPRNTAEFENEWATQAPIRHKLPGARSRAPTSTVKSSDYNYARMRCTHYAVPEAYTKSIATANVSDAVNLAMPGSGLRPEWVEAFKKDDRWASTKVKLVLSTVRAHLLSSSGSILIFDGFVASLQALEIGLSKNNIQSVFIHGGVSDATRNRILENFSSKRGPRILLATEDVMAIGHDLTVANTVILLSPSYSPAVKAQCIGRAHRHGQKQDVTVYHFVANESVETIITEVHQATRTEQNDGLFDRNLTWDVGWYSGNCRTFGEFRDVFRVY